MSQKTLIGSPRSNFLNPLLFVGFLSVRSVPVLTLMAILGSELAQANPLYQPNSPQIPQQSAIAVDSNLLFNSQKVNRQELLATVGASTQEFKAAFTSAVTPLKQQQFNSANLSFGGKYPLKRENIQSAPAVLKQANNSQPRLNLTSSIISEPTVAAVPNPVQKVIPTLNNSQPLQQSEDQLIQQLSGKSVVTPAVATPTAPPAFTPPSPAATDNAGYASSPAISLPLNTSAGNGKDITFETANQPSYADVNQGLLAPSGQGQNNWLYNPADPIGQPSAQIPDPTQPVAPTTDNAIPYPTQRNPDGTLRTIEPPSALPPQRRSLLRSTALGAPQLQFQGVYLLQGEESSARARVSGVYPLTNRVLFGATVDLTNGNGFSDSQTEGLNLNELYIATSLQDLPNLRFVLGQLDLTSYFDRNSFAKDGATHFFNPVFQTNPALSATGISSRPGVLVNWALTDNIEAKAAAFSSARNIGDFSLDAFAGEVGIRYGNAIIRGTYASDRDAGVRDSFRESFAIDRGDGRSGPLKSDREESYGVNAEVFIPKYKLGLFGRYGRYDNRDLGKGGDTYSLGLNFLDVFSQYDRLGLAYGRTLSNDRLRSQAGEKTPDVLELFYDFRFLSNLRLGFTVQQLNDFSETILGFRLKTEFDVTPTNRRFQ